MDIQQARRVKKLVQFLEALDIPEHKFCLAEWHTSYRNMVALTDFGHIRTVILEHIASNSPPSKNVLIQNKYGFWEGAECQTAACAIGWAATMEEFNQEGFGLSEEGKPVYRFENGFKRGIPAIEKFFGIYGGDMDAFFEYSYDEPPTPAMVAEKIRETFPGLNYDEVTT